MADYALTMTDAVKRTEDGALIPNDEGNRDWQDYQAWLAKGGVPDPYEEPPFALPTMTTHVEVTFEHENRLRALEGKPMVTPQEFMKGRRF